MRATILIPTYNRKRLIGRALTCALGQSVECKVIVYDDASTDHPWRAISKFACPRLRYERGSENIGIGAVRSLMVDMVDTDYIAWLDSDDACNKYRVELQIKAMEENDLQWCRTSVFKTRLVENVDWTELPRQGHKGNFMTPSTMVRTGFAKKHRHQPFRCGEDTIWELEAIRKRAPGGILPLVLYYWNKAEASRLSTVYRTRLSEMRAQKSLLSRLRRELENRNINRRGTALSYKYAMDLVERCCA